MLTSNSDSKSSGLCKQHSSRQQTVVVDVVSGSSVLSGAGNSLRVHSLLGVSKAPPLLHTPSYLAGGPLSIVLAKAVLLVIIVNGVYSFTLLAPLLPPPPPPATNNNNNNNSSSNNNNQRALHNNQPTRTDHKPQQQQQPAPHNNPFNVHINYSSQQSRPLIASSSGAAQLEIDLNDSSVRTRLGVFNGTWQDQFELLAASQQQSQLWPRPPSADFEDLISRLLRPISAGAQKSAKLPPPPGPPYSAAADRLVGDPALLVANNNVAADANNKTTMRFFRNNKTFASIVYTNEQPSFNSRPLQMGTQIQAPPPPRRKLINCHLVDMEKHSSDVVVFEAKYQIKTIDVEFREMMQLIDACTDIARLRSSSAASAVGAAAGQSAGSSGSAGQATGTGSKLFAAALPKMAPGQATKLGAGQTPAAAGKSSADLLNYIKRHLPGQAQQQPPASGKQPPSPAAVGATTAAKGLVAKVLNRAGETGKRLVLGEVTPMPGQVEARGGSIRDALQEISAYDSTDLLAIWRGILPGTNWCGMGDRATSYNDLGFETEIDICCRAHDFCPIRLSAFSSGYGLFNWSFYTRSHCWCDQNFLDCLQRAPSPLSSVVMKFYFTIMKTTCLHDNETIGATADSYYTALANARHKQQIMPAAASSSWWSPLGGNNNNNNNGNNKHKLSMLAGSSSSSTSRSYEHEHNMLLEQIRAKMPIPALKLSRAFYSKLDVNPSASSSSSSFNNRQAATQSTKRLGAGYK